MRHRTHRRLLVAVLTLAGSVAAVSGSAAQALDGIAFAGSRGRMEQLQLLAERVGAGPVPGTADVALVSIGL